MKMRKLIVVNEGWNVEHYIGLVQSMVSQMHMDFECIVAGLNEAIHLLASIPDRKQIRAVLFFGSSLTEMANELKTSHQDVDIILFRSGGGLHPQGLFTPAGVRHLNLDFLNPRKFSQTFEYPA